VGTIFEVKTRSAIYDAFESDIARPIDAGLHRSVHERQGDDQFDSSRVSSSPRATWRVSALMLRDGRWGAQQVICVVGTPQHALRSPHPRVNPPA
jgi:hypothetical protein